MFTYVRLYQESGLMKHQTVLMSMHSSIEAQLDIGMGDVIIPGVSPWHYCGQ